MDELRAFFNDTAPTRESAVHLRAPLTGGVCISQEDTLGDMSKKAEHSRSMVPSGTDYAREVKQRETDLYLKNAVQRLELEKSRAEGLDSIEELSTVGTSITNIANLTEEAMTEVYNKYTFQRKEDTHNLAINSYKDLIIDSIKGLPVTIIEGPTGCGKTTQVPQWILDNCYQEHKPCKVVVTQPRRIAAISIAKRVAQERGWDVGGIVGYQVGLENRTSSDTRISYVTTGILLQKLVANKTMNEYSHIILDEVHERGQEMDFLLLIVKKLLYTVSPLVKIILMSATFNSSMFSKYFTVQTPRNELGDVACCVEIARKDSMFTVKEFYLNDLQKFSTLIEKATPKGGEPAILPEMHHLVVKLVNAFEHIDKIEDKYTDSSTVDLPSVLIFLPGINEIEDLYACLTDTNLRKNLCDYECAQYKWWVLPLHSTITADEQVRVFQRAPPGHRKIILATNIAESSITVPDIKYVIDYCLMKTLVADHATNFTSLQLMWASKANCEQRAGRAGRVRDGRVYRLISCKAYENLADEGVPEIIRCPLERLVLLAKMLEMGPPSDILALAMDPPDMSNILRTILVLKEIGALKKTVNEEWSDTDGDITYMGRILAKLPLDVKISKLIVIGYIYGCLEETIIMAAAMSVKNVFSSPFRERLNAYNSKLTWADGSMSDCIAFLNVYKVWSHLRQQNYFKQQGHSEGQWARRFYVQIRALREMNDTVREIKLRLSREGIEITKGMSPWAKHELPLILKIIIAGAFYPQYFVQASLNEDRERDAVRTLGGLDPRNTVYLQNFPENQPHDIYVSTIKRAIKQQIGDEPKVTFDKNSRKVFLTFSDGANVSDRKADSGDPTIPGQVVLPVYKCVKARQLKMDVRVPVLPVEKANELAAALERTKLDVDMDKMVPRLPEIDDTHFPLRICLLLSVSKFWVHHDDESTGYEFGQLCSILNKRPLIAHTGQVCCGDIYAAPHKQNTFMRARITKVLPRNMVEVFYIDEGSVGTVNSCNLRMLPPIACGPPLAMQCRLAALAPQPLLDPHGHWSRQALQCFQDLTRRGRLIAKVYSVVQGVVSIELLAEGGQININQELLKKGLAVPCEESYESKMNHDLRQNATELTLKQKGGYNKEQIEHAYDQLRQVDAPPADHCVKDHLLKGPNSPLESTIRTLMYASREKMVNIEWNSVNSVLLDTDPQQTYERLLVAAHIGENEMNSKLTLRHTTLLPNIPGLPAIIALLFCPAAELRRDPSGTRYVSVLCGLGSDHRAAPHFPEHDLLINIDADMDVEDMCWVNHIRHLMDYMMYCSEGQDQPTADDETRPRVPRIIRENLMHLLKKRRKYHQIVHVPNAWEWKSVPEDEILEITNPDMVQRAVVFPLHSPQELRPRSREHLLELKRENDHLKLLVSRSSISSTVEVACKLCGTRPMPTHAMRIHLYSNAHLEKEEDFNMFHS